MSYSHSIKDRVLSINDIYSQIRIAELPEVPFEVIETNIPKPINSIELKRTIKFEFPTPTPMSEVTIPKKIFDGAIPNISSDKIMMEWTEIHPITKRPMKAFTILGANI